MYVNVICEVYEMKACVKFDIFSINSQSRHQSEVTDGFTQGPL